MAVFAIILPWMASYGSERSFLLIFSARGDLEKVSLRSDARKCQNQVTPFNLTNRVNVPSSFVCNNQEMLSKKSSRFNRQSFPGSCVPLWKLSTITTSKLLVSVSISRLREALKNSFFSRDNSQTGGPPSPSVLLGIKIWILLKGAGAFHSAGQSKEGDLVLALQCIRFSWNFYQIISGTRYE